LALSSLLLCATKLLLDEKRLSLAFPNEAWRSKDSPFADGTLCQ
jgi:hypothetical protein